MPTYPLITTAPDHYDRHKTPRLLSLAVIPPPEIGSHSHVKIIGSDGSAYDVKINGRPRTFKTRPEICVPWKYGYRGEYGHFHSTDGHTWDSDIPYRVLSASDQEA